MVASAFSLADFIFSLNYSVFPNFLSEKVYTISDESAGNFSLVATDQESPVHATNPTVYHGICVGW